MSAQPASIPTPHDITLDPILAALQRIVPAPRLREATLFAQAFYARMSPEEYALRGPDDWAALARGFMDFVRERRAGRVAIRIFNPTRAEHGWESPHTVIQIANDDMPFLVDTVSMVLAQHDAGIHVLGHPVLKFRRDPGGNVLALGEGQLESLMHIEIDRQTEADELARIEHDILAALDDVRACVQDWDAMRAKLRAIADELPSRSMPVPDAVRDEAHAFLQWAADNHFTFLGYRDYSVDDVDGEPTLHAVPDTGLGLLRAEARAGKPRPLRALAAQSFIDGAPVEPLILTKTNARSTVHRPGYMDYIGVLTFDAQGRPNGEQRFIGLYTSSAYSRRPWDIPLVRERHEYVMAKSGLAVRSHSGKALRHILESLPRDELF